MFEEYDNVVADNMEMKISRWFPMADIWLSADFNSRMITLELKKMNWELVIKLPKEKREMEFLSEALSLIQRIEDLLLSFEFGEEENIKDIILSIV